MRQLLELTARLYPFNLPENRTDVPRVTSILAAAGLANGSYTAPSSNLNYTLAGLLVNSTISKTLQSPSRYEIYGDGGRGLLPSESGDFHSDYINRAYIAWSAYLELQTYEALYPSYFGPARATKSTTSNLLSLLADQSLLFTFSSKPPVSGFWSLTAYGQNNFLVPNPLHRFSLGDRSNVTYPDGSLVYGIGGSSSKDHNEDNDKPFQLLMQAADVPPPVNWTSNWLPAPAGGGNFTVNLR